MEKFRKIVEQLIPELSKQIDEAKKEMDMHSSNGFYEGYRDSAAKYVALCNSGESVVNLVNVLGWEPTGAIDLKCKTVH